MKRVISCTLALLVAILAVPPQAVGRDVAPVDVPVRQHVDLAICLDTSGSMRGLISSAKQKLWAVVNELATAKPRPILRVALYQYGNNGLKPDTGWVQQLCPLTDDLDTVYEKLFPLTTHGGTELVARVVRAAAGELEWSTEKNALKIIFVAGNEPATQDTTYKLQDTCRETIGKGIIINTIFCGPAATGRRTGWKDAADWADGQYASIDQNRGTVAILTPYDKELAKLSAELNTTYIPYGDRGRRGLLNQSKQDVNSGTMGAPASAERAVAKASAVYHNAAWDLVDALKDGKIDLAEAKAEDLPEPMRKMTVEQRKAHVAQHAKRRAEIQAKIRKLNAQRAEHVKKEMAARGLSEKAALDAALRSAIRVQATQKGFVFPKPKPAPAPKPK